MDASFCDRGAGPTRSAGGLLEILNTDQGAQFTSEAFADRAMLAAGVTFYDRTAGAASIDNRLHRAAVDRSAEVRGGVPLPELHGEAGSTPNASLVPLRLDFYNEVRSRRICVAERADAGRDLSRRRGGAVRTTRRDAIHEAQPAQRRLQVVVGLPRAGSLASPRRQPVPTGRRRLYSNRARGRASRPAGSATPVVPGSDALGPGSSEITEGIGDHRNPTLTSPSDCPTIVGPPQSSTLSDTPTRRRPRSTTAGPGRSPATSSRGSPSDPLSPPTQRSPLPVGVPLPTRLPSPDPILSADTLIARPTFRERLAL